MTTTHRYVRIHDAMAYVQLGWMPHPTLEGTYHGQFSVHMEWRCCCGRPPAEAIAKPPRSPADAPIATAR